MFPLSAVRNFFITFILSLVIFGAIGYFFSDYAVKAIAKDGQILSIGVETSRPPEETTAPPDSSVDDPRPIVDPSVKGTSFNMLFILTDYQPEVYDYRYDERILREDGFPEAQRVVSAENIILVRVDREDGNVILSSIPASSRIMDHGIYKTLGSLYGSYGISYLVEKAAFLFGLPIDYYMCFSASSLSSLINARGGLRYAVPQTMNQTDEEGNVTYQLSKGSQTLSGEQLLFMLRYDRYTEGQNGSRSATNMNFMIEMISRFCIESRKAGALSDLSAVMPYLETNFNESVLTEKLDLLFASAPFMKVMVNYPGSATVYDGVKYFEPNVSKAWTLFEEYKYKGN